MTDVVIIGGGIAGIAACAQIAPHLKVTLLEAEPELCYHSSGRSAATFIEDYGNRVTKELNKEREQRKEPPILVGAGINKGLVVSGNIGSRDLMDYTVIGDTVNVASRLCAAAGPGEIMVSESVYKIIKGSFSSKRLSPIKVKGKEKKVPVFLVTHKKSK